MSSNKKLSPNDYNTPYRPTWCPGCGNFGIWTALKTALAELDIQPHNVVIVFGIGCSGNMANTVKSYGFHSLHGRTLPVALGAKLANKDIVAIAISGDGDCYGEGMNHFIHSARYNTNMLLLVCNNHLFSLTTGQASPTSEIGMISKTTPWGEIKQPINPLAISISAGATFVARGASYEIPHLTSLIKQGIEHQGFSHIDILQPCPTFNKTQTIPWYKERAYQLENQQHDPGNKKAALDLSLEHEKLPLGILYQTQKPTYEQGFPQLDQKPLVNQKINYKVNQLIKEFI